MTKDCFICNRIQQIKDGTNPYFVKELSTGYVVLADNQYYRGLTIFLGKEHKSELHEVAKDWRNTFLAEMADVAEGVYRAFHPKKINYELLGNNERHMHWWIIPRYPDDAEPTWPIWTRDKQEIWSDQTKPSADELARLVAELQSGLK